ncbi:hypothetical protein H6F93_00630 [Leptolyngbya sp. FACHB-671]|uniref:transglutaminase-like domain-containing protein n=1 Tax=Leptolyngbya sp. FACHB-671 TaxID=2692812 RepID=UPI001686656F|nr:transglutaminase-like domain-containing protein [Leptolyngbya sp. FACHB-671]MBD2066056.1 hypothetical protein [Leptolyngbya sp. FACHB-671]
MMEWIWTKANEKELAQFATDSALQLFNLNVSSFDLIREAQFESLIETVYNTLVEQKIKYDLEKFSTVETHQRIRTPVEILSQPRQGTCLDLAILFSGLCLGCNLLPKLILLEGHALVAVSLTLKRSEWNSNRDNQKKFLGKRVKDLQGTERIEPEVFRDIETLKEMIADDNGNGIYCIVECTGFAYSKTLQPDSTELAGVARNPDGFLTFQQAKEVGRKQLERLPFRYAIDIAVAHESWGIKPASFEIPNTWEKPVIKMYAKQDLENIRRTTALGIENDSNELVDMEADQKVREAEDSVIIGIVNKGKGSSGEYRSKQDLGSLNRAKLTGQEHKQM